MLCWLKIVHFRSVKKAVNQEETFSLASLKFLRELKRAVMISLLMSWIFCVCVFIFEPYT